MTRSDLHLEAMLRHLGAAYYDSLHGRAGEADVTRAVAEVAGRMGESPSAQPAGHATPSRVAAQHHGSGQHHGRHHSRVRDIMTTSVISVDRITPYKEIAGLLAKHHVSGVPVLTMGRHVAGVVTDADLVAAAGHHRGGASRSWAGRHRSRQHQAMTAEQLMTSPAVTIYPDAPIATVARVMTDHHVRRLPVVDQDGVLIGIVSRPDLLKVFLRPDADISRQITELLAEALPAGAEDITVTVTEGVVTLAGRATGSGSGELRLAVRLAADIDGVVDVLDRTASPLPA